MPQRGLPSQEGLWAPSCLLMAHEPEPEASGLLDLSFLTEEEQEVIAEVLKRDAYLRQLEEGRVSKLRASLADPEQLKILTGDWFQEARAQRHHHAYLGSDLVRASIRKKKTFRGDQALGSNREPETAGKETEGEMEPRLPIGKDPQERLSEAEASDLEEPQAQEAPDPGLAQVYEEADPEPEEPQSREKVEPQLSPVQIQAVSEILENGEETPGPGPSLDRMLSSSSSVSSLNSTLSGSQMSLSGEAEAGAVQVRGSVHFALRYELDAAELRVHVIQCQNLAAARRRRSDPYVKSYLFPDKQSKRKTAVKKRNLNPVFNETLRVPPSPDDLPSRGQLSLSLKYVPAGSEGAGLPPSGEIHFWVKEAHDLVPRRSGPLDTYIQCFVLPDDSRASRQRTRVVRKSLSPVFNHTMVYDGFEPADLRQACAELSLWDHGALASHQLGGTRLSLGTGSSYGLQVPWMDSTPEERHLWQTLLERPCEWVDGLLPLRTNLVPRT
uniref:Synaptotagmin like 1 n=1 Tax=Rousettus aegyptiacus TaxID=9407 RepID=A0A7J8KHW4_ROUAE|nr:synaptotagmin like 1 [Rousettus aegyptiacus]